LLNDHQTPDTNVFQAFIRYNKCKEKVIKALKPLHFEVGV